MKIRDKLVLGFLAIGLLEVARRQCPFTKILASLLNVISVVVLIGWISGLFFPAKLSVDEVPMTQSTAFYLL